MAFIMPEVALQRMIQVGLKELRQNRAAFDCIFAQYLCEEMQASYGQAHIDKIYNWFNGTRLPVLQAWSFDGTRVPAFSIHLADESEDESKAAFGDFWGIGEDTDIQTGVSTVSLDIGIHADKSKDHVLWMYYILTYIFYKNKMLGRKLGLQLFTFRANDYNKESKYMADNVWSRWIRFRTTVQNYIDGDEYIEADVELTLIADNADQPEQTPTGVPVPVEGEPSEEGEPVQIGGEEEEEETEVLHSTTLISDDIEAVDMALQDPDRYTNP